MDEDGSGGGSSEGQLIEFPRVLAKRSGSWGRKRGFVLSDPTDNTFHFPKLPLLLESKVATTHGKNSAYSLNKTRLQCRLSHDRPLVTKKTINSNN